MKDIIKKLTNKMVCDDAISLMKSLPDKSVDLVLTDPPYNASNSNLSLKNYKTINEKWDKTFDPIPFLDEAFRVIKDGGSVLAFCSYHLLGKYLMYPHKVQQVIHWEHINPMPALCKVYHPAIEYIVWYSTPKYTFNKPAGKNIIQEKKAYRYGEKFDHPSVKPSPLIEKLMTVHSNEGDLIVDPYMGTGTTCIVAKKLKRRFIGCDNEQKYVDIALGRLEEKGKTKG